MTIFKTKQVKEKMIKDSIPFTEVEVSNNKEIWNKIIEMTGNEYLPAIFIRNGDTDKGPIFCPERDFNTDDEAVNIIKGYMTKEEGGN